MKLNIKAMGLALGLIWGAAILVTGLANLMWEGYGQAGLAVIASVYPGYSGEASIGQVLIGTTYGLLDGFIGGVVFAWVYNQFAKD